ncbi:MAG: SRPBCC family protein [Bacteroidota bacterium]
MEAKAGKIITIRTSLTVPVSRVWNLWTGTEHIRHWNKASDDWHTTRAESDLRVGGRFLSRMEARDGSVGFDFSGEYTHIAPHQRIDYLLDDGRKVRINFISAGEKTTVEESFEAEDVNTIELQRTGWQAILDNFKKYAEAFGVLIKLHFEIMIGSDTAKVYKAMIDEKLYSEWTSVFNPTSRFSGSWAEGSVMKFLGTEQDGTEGGMISRIRKHIPGSYISIEHLGMIRNGKEITTGDEIEEWSGAREDYTFTTKEGKTLVSVDTDSSQRYRSYFEDIWPLALNKLREICER